MVSEATLDKLQSGGRIAERGWPEVLDWLGRYQFSQNHNVNFWYVNHFLCEDALKILSSNPGRWKPLSKVYDSMASASKFPFLLHCFRMRGFLSVDELVGLWYRCFEDDVLLNWHRRRDLLYVGQQIQTSRNECLDYPRGIAGDELLNSMLTDHLLIDNSVVIDCFCRCRKEGWKYLRHTKTRNMVGEANLDQTLKNALLEHNTAEFCIRWDMLGRKTITFVLLYTIARAGAVGIFGQMLERMPEAKLANILDELCISIVASLPEPTVTQLLKVMETVHPVVLRQVHDCWGRNLLWYAMHNRRFAWFHPKCTLTPFLLEAGCDPKNHNQLGLAWQDVNDWLTLPKQEQMMRDRWNTNYYFSV
jgi:hypothetical protein